MPRNINNSAMVALLGLSLTCAFPVWGASDSEEYLAEAKQYLAEGKRKEAVIQLKNSLKSDPSNAAARVLLGSLYLASGDAPSAQKELDRAARLGAPKEEWMVGLGQALMMQNDFDGVLNSMVPDDSMSIESRGTVLAMRGNAYVGMGNETMAVEAFDQALAVHPSNPLARLGKARLLLEDSREDEAAQQFSEVLNEYPNHVQTRLARGNLYRSQGKLKEAIADFGVVVKQAPHEVRGYIGRALSYIQMGEDDKAVKDVKQLQRRARKAPITNYLQGLLAFNKQDYGTASEELQEVLRDAPDHFQAQVLYGITNYALGNYTIADDYLGRVLQVTPGNAHVRKLVAASRLKLKDPERAIDALLPFTRPDQESQDAQALALLGTAYLLNGDNENGTRYMARAVEAAPDQAVLRTQLAAGRIALGDAQGAITDLESAVNLGQDVVQADVLLVLSHLNQKQYVEAIKAAQALETRMQDSPIPPNLTGLAYLAQKKFTLAREKFDQALEIDPKFIVARMNLARLALLNNDPEGARKQYQQILSAFPEHVEAMVGMAGLESVAGNAEKSEAWLLKANQANPRALKPMLLLAEAHLKRSEPLKATNLLTSLSEAQNDLLPVLRIRGMANLQNGEFSSARAVFEQIVARDPENVEGWFQLARAQAAVGDNQGANESFDRAIALDTNYQLPLVWIGKGELELREKRFQEALDLAREMQKHFPDNAMAYEVEAAAHRGMGNAHEALGAVEKAVRAEGNSQRINLFAHTLAASGNTPKAVFMLREWLEKNPEDGVSWTTLGMMLQQMGRVDDAVKAYETSLRFTGGNPVVMNNMAWLFMESDIEQAEKYAKQAYEIAPERAEIVDTYGWVVYRQGNHQKALGLLQQALVIAPKNPEIGLHVAQALHSLGRDREARPLVERIVEEHPHTEYSAPARALLRKLN